jgi:hypothetical protein
MKLPLRGSYSIRCTGLLLPLHNLNDHGRCHNIPLLDPILHYTNLVYTLTPSHLSILKPICYYPPSQAVTRLKY